MLRGLVMMACMWMVSVVRGLLLSRMMDETGTCCRGVVHLMGRCSRCVVLMLLLIVAWLLLGLVDLLIADSLAIGLLLGVLKGCVIDLVLDGCLPSC